MIPGGVQLSFPGKKRVKQHVRVMDLDFKKAMQLALDDGTYFSGSAGVDIWHPPVLPKGLKPKDLRTLSANRFLLDLCIKDKSTAKPEKRIKQLIKKTAERIGHTPQVCKAAYLSREVVKHGENVLRKKNKHTKSVKKHAYKDVYKELQTVLHG